MYYAVCCCCSAKLIQSCPTLCDSINRSPPGSPVPGILQARTLEWAAISFSNAWKWKVKGRSLSRVRLLVTPWTAAHQAPPSMGLSRQEYWSGVPMPSPIMQYNLVVYLFYIQVSSVQFSRSFVSDSLRPHELQPTRPLHPWDFPGKSTGVGCQCLLQQILCSPYQIANGVFHRIRTKKPQNVHGDTKTLNSQSSHEKEKRSWRNQAPRPQTILQCYSHQNSMVLAQKEKI